MVKLSAIILNNTTHTISSFQILWVELTWIRFYWRNVNNLAKRFEKSFQVYRKVSEDFVYNFVNLIFVYNFVNLIFVYNFVNLRLGFHSKKIFKINCFLIFLKNFLCIFVQGRWQPTQSQLIQIYSMDWTDIYDTHNIEHRTEPVCH